MFEYTKFQITAIAKENNFKKETLEKVLRLVDVLEFINSNDNLSPYLALKGGTAINLTIFNLPRLSVDIDLDFSFDGSKEEMLDKRQQITNILNRYMMINNYSPSKSSKNRFALDSFVYSYMNCFGNKDNLKIEINYMNRNHIYDISKNHIKLSFLNSINVNVLSKYELYGSKIKALIERCTVRDVYDVYYMLNAKLFNENEYIKIKKCLIFYIAIGNTTNLSYEDIIKNFYLKIDSYAINRIPQYLSSTLRINDTFTLKDAVIQVKNLVTDFTNFSTDEQKFLQEFSKGNYIPELLFDDVEVLKNIKKHPMAIRKTTNK